MKELLRTNDAVLLSWLMAELRAVAIDALVFDLHASIMEGSIAAIPRRVMVNETDWQQARAVLDQAPGYAP